jgi:hypothetical protein
MRRQGTRGEPGPIHEWHALSAKEEGEHITPAMMNHTHTPVMTLGERELAAGL